MSPFYSTRSETDPARLMALYDLVTGAKERVREHYEFHSRRRGEGAFFRSFVVSCQGRDVGLLEYGKHHQLPAPHEAWLELNLDSQCAWNFEAARGLLMCSEEDLSRHGFRSFHTETRDTRLHPLLRDMKWNEVMEIVDTSLDLRSMLDLPFPALSEGCTVVSLPTLRERYGDKVAEHIQPLIREITADTPGFAEVALSLSVERIRDSLQDQGSYFLPEAFFFLEKDGELIGVHQLISSEPGQVSAAVTGILASHRRRGHMRALKLHGLAWSARAGFKSFRSNNEKNNPMLALNLSLGFRETSRSIVFHKSVD